MEIVAGLTSIRRAKPWRQERVWSWAALAGIVALVAVARFQLRNIPLERDEGEFAYGGQLLLHGIWPAHLLYTLKLPGTHAAYAILMAVFGQSCAGIHLGFLVVNCATVLLMFALARAVGSRLAGVVAAAAYAWFSLSPDALGTAAHATHFVVLFGLAGLVLLWRATANGRRLVYFWSGLLLSTSVLMKHNGLLFCVFGLAWVLGLGLSKRLGPTTVWLKAGAVFLLGLAAPFLMLALILLATGTWSTTWFWAVTYARAYAQPYPGLVIVWRSLTQRLPEVLQLPFTISFLGLIAVWARRDARRAALFATGVWLSSMLAVIPGLHLRPHYYVLLMPGLALMLGLLAQRTTALLQRVDRRVLAIMPSLAFAVWFAQGIRRDAQFWFPLTPIAASRTLYGYQPFPEAVVLADFIRQHSAKEERIAVLGSEPEIYFYAQRRSATGFIYTYPLTEHQPFAAQMRRQMAQELAAVRPRYIVQVRTWTSWLARPGSLQRIDELCRALTPEGYRAIGACDVVPSESRVTWQWRADAALKPPGPETQLLLLERDAP